MGTNYNVVLIVGVPDEGPVRKLHEAFDDAVVGRRCPVHGDVGRYDRFCRQCGTECVGVRRSRPAVIEFEEAHPDSGLRSYGNLGSDAYVGVEVAGMYDITRSGSEVHTIDRSLVEIDFATVRDGLIALGIENPTPRLIMMVTYS